MRIRLDAAMVKRGLVVSPFLKAAMLERFPSPWESTIVVSRADEIDREFEGTAEAASILTGVPFLQVAVDSDKNLTLRAAPDTLR